MNEVIIADKNINITAIEKEDMEGLNVANYESVLRWLLRGDTLCDVTIPWKSYIQTLAYISIQGFTKTCYKIFEDKVCKENAKEALDIYENYLEKRSNQMPNLYNEILKMIKQLIDR